MLRKWIMVATSALCGTSLFIIPEYAYPLAFFFLLPIFFGISRGYRLSFCEGFVWGLIFFGGNLFGVFMLLHHNAEGYARYLGYAFLVLYFALYPALWWAGAWYLTQALKLTTYFKKSFVWCVTGTFYFFFLHHYSLFIFGQWGGYTVGNPLIALVHTPLILTFLPAVGTTLLWCVLIIAQSCMAWILLRIPTMMQKGGIVVSVLAITMLLHNDKVHEGAEGDLQQFPEYLATIGYVSAPIGEHDYPWDRGQEITHKLFDFRCRHPEVTTILMPESSCKFALNRYPKITQSWIDTVLHDDCTLFIGSHRREKEKLFNCLYCIDKGLIISPYDKHIPIPFGEYIPYPWNKIQSVKNLFLNNKESFYAGCDTCPPLIASRPSTFACIPQICYEFYFASEDPGRVNDPARTLPILCVTNDGWYEKTPYFQELLLLLARYRAMEWRRPIVYIAHTGGWWLGEKGEMVVLKR